MSYAVDAVAVVVADRDILVVVLSDGSTFVVVVAGAVVVAVIICCRKVGWTPKPSVADSSTIVNKPLNNFAMMINRMYRGR